MKEINKKTPADFVRELQRINYETDVRSLNDVIKNDENEEVELEEFVESSYNLEEEVIKRHWIFLVFLKFLVQESN